MGVRMMWTALRWATVGVLVVGGLACEGTQREFPRGSLPADGGMKGEPTTEALPLGARATARGALGEACGDARRCASGYCVDGVCCDGACTELCATCAAPGSEGTCSPAASDAACDAIACPGSTECRGRDQTGLALNCEGVGKCRAAFTCAPLEQPQGTPCQNGSGLCDGQGACIVPGKAALGSACSLDDECAEGHCVTGPSGAGICCDALCDGICQECSAAGHCDATPSTDARCQAVVCPADNPCRDYPATLTQDLCRGFGQCKGPQACVATALRPAASCDCDADLGCTLRRGVSCDADSDCGPGAACVLNRAGSPICCAEACGAGLFCAGDGSGCVACEGADVECDGTLAVRCEAGVRTPESCAKGCSPGVGCNSETPVGFTCESATCVAGATCQSDTVGRQRCCVRDCAAEGKQCAPDGSCLCPPGQAAGASGCALQQGDPCGAGAAACGSGLSCVDGVCCNDVCDGACERCNVTGSVGACTFDPNERVGCAAGEQCVGRDDCRGGNAQTCTLGSDCVSNNCEPLLGVNGQNVCCAASCTSPQGFCANDGSRCLQCQTNADCPNGCNVATGLCNPLNTPGAVCNVAQQCASGVCLPDVANAQLNRCCPACGAGQLCSAQGTCQDPPPVGCPQGTRTCSDGRCIANNQCCETCSGGRSCNAASGNCECPNGQQFINNQCRLNLGAACTANGTPCANGLCVDGVCCESACNGLCMQCQAGSGRCVMPANDTACQPITCAAPTNVCQQSAPSNATINNNRCQSLGQCKTAANCAAPVAAPARTACEQGVDLGCSAAAPCLVGRICDGASNCVAPTVSCAGVPNRAVSAEACCVLPLPPGDPLAPIEAFTTACFPNGTGAITAWCDSTSDCPTGSTCCLEDAGNFNSIACTAACAESENPGDPTGTGTYLVCRSPGGGTTQCPGGRACDRSHPELPGWTFCRLP